MFSCSVAVLNESLALNAARLYSDGFTFAKISKELEVSQGSVGGLIRDGIASMADMESAAPEISEESSHPVSEFPNQPIEDYATVDDLNDLRKDIQYLASVIGGESPSNPDEYEEGEDIEVIPPVEGFIKDPSLTRHSVWLKPKTQMYFDMSRQGIFANYEGSRELGPFTQFNGNLSDFFNIIVDDYFIRNYNADIGILMRRYSR